MARFIKCVFILLVYSNTYSNPRPIPPIIKKIISINDAVLVTNIVNEQWIDIDELPFNYKQEGQHLIKTEKGLFITIPGTGRVYKAFIKGDKMDFYRIDSTYFNGYNFNSLTFNIKNDIYNFGGEGFWHTNGDLRLFDDSITHEWNAIRLNKSIYRSFNLHTQGLVFYYLNLKKKTLTIDGSISSQNYTKEPLSDTIHKNKLYTLDLSTENWKEIGRKNFQNLCIFSFSPLGILSYETIIDIENNKIFKHNLYIQLQSIIGKKSRIYGGPTISFCIDSTIYFGNAAGNFDSLTISRSNLIDTGEPAYFPKEPDPLFSKDDILMFSLFGTSALSLILLVLNLKQRRNRNDSSRIQKPIQLYKQAIPIEETSPEKNENNTLYRSGKLVELMNEQEISFLKYLYDHSEDERMTTIEEINKKLGTSNKTVEIQKKMRSDMINGVNAKLSTFSKSSKPVIDKQRSEFDKRSFEYFIHPDHMGLVENIIKVNKG